MNPGKLDNKVKDSLQNMEVPFDPSGWDRLERSLDARGNASKFKFKWNWKYSLNSFVVLAAASAVTWYVLSDKTEDRNAAYKPPAPVIKQNNPVVREQAPAGGDQDPVVLADAGIQPSSVYYATWPKKNDAGATLQENGTMDEDGSTEFSDAVKSRPFIENPLMRGSNLVSSTDQKKVSPRPQYPISKDELDKLTSMEYLAKQRTHLFGDQIDSKKGAIYNTKEDDSIKRLLYLKQKEEQDKKEQEEWEQRLKHDSVPSVPDTPPNDTPKRKRDKKSGKGKKDNAPPQDSKNASSDDPSGNPSPSGDVNPEPEKKEEHKKKHNDKPKDGGRDKDPFNPYRN